MYLCDRSDGKDSEVEDLCTVGSAGVFWNGPKLVQAKASPHFLGKDA
jgi:hypothetical protein